METSQTLENNKKIARQSFEAIEKNELDTLDKITDQSKFKMHYPGSEAPLNFAASKQMNTEYSNAFSNMKVSIDLQIAEGDYVTTCVTYTGVHKGTFQGVPATNKKVKSQGISIQQIKNGKIVEQWTQFDTLGFMQQIGAVPELAEQRH